ncbi:MAG TPA: signal recognition particle-docking protein FtsY [Candidatus Bathyarchaeota archaeon]|nr:signal recognition particle-docking protein FtsY [Candidatus Bathyarchaeota archaeon]
MFNRLKKTFQQVLTTISMKNITEKDLEPVLFNWKLQLLSCDVAYQVAEYFEEKVLTSLKGRKISRFNKELPLIVKNALKEAVLDIVRKAGTMNLTKLIEEKTSNEIPFKMVFVGVNGSGKTTTIAKLAYILKRKDLLSVLACSDTFRAGAEEQLAIHANRLKLKMIKHQYGADPAAVAYDAVKYAQSHDLPVVLIDTAGRMQTDKGLMDELKKIIRVINADLVVFIGDALAGNDALYQAEIFDKEVGIDCSIITKVDADVKGGTALSILYATKKPILYLGVGQKYSDLIPFTVDWLLNKIFG